MFMDRRYRICTISLFVGLVLLSFFSIKDYGISWDETFRFKGGDQKLAYYKALFSDEVAVPLEDSYPGFFDLPLAIVHDLFPEMGTRSQKGHVWSLMFGLLGVLSTWRIAALVGGERAGFWAFVLIATLPRYYGHMFFNPKDIPLAGVYVFSLWMLLRVMRQWPKASWRSVAVLGLAAGVSISVRIAGFLTLFYFALFVGAHLWSAHFMESGKLKSPDFEDLKTDILYWLKRGLLAGAIALLVLFVFWPTIHRNPLVEFQGAVDTVQSYGWDAMVLMDGVFYSSQDLPFYYVPYWLFVTLPDHMLLLLLLVVGVVLLELLVEIRGRKLSGALDSRLCLVVLFGVIFPFVYILCKQPVLYDGMRHFIFILPPLVCSCALALERVLRALSGKRASLVNYSIQGLLVALVTWTICDLVRLHPYQYIYFNHISGGLPAAYNSRDTDYWGLSYREAAEWLNMNVPTEAEGGLPKYRVLQKNAPWMLQEFLDPRFEIVFNPNQANFYVSFTRFNLHAEYPDLRVLHVIEREGVPLCFIFVPQVKKQEQLK